MPCLPCARPAHYQSLEAACVARLMAVRVAAAPAPLRVLDYGCGHGKYLRLLRDLGCVVYGVDVNEASLARLRAEGFSVCSPAEMTFAEGCLDVVFVSHLIEHLDPAALLALLPRLCRLLTPAGRLVLISPLAGERFYHDFSHVRPYYPQSIRHAFGQQDALLSFLTEGLIELEDIHFFRDPFRTRRWRSFYVACGWRSRFTRALNRGFDLAWRLSGGRIGVHASWLGVYRRQSGDPAAPGRGG